MNTNVVSLDEASKQAETASHFFDALVYVLWVPGGYVVDVGPQNEEEAEDFIICEEEIEMTFYGGERV